MKQKALKRIIVFVLILAGILLNSCQKDDLIEHSKPNQILRFTKKNISDLFKEDKFKSAFEKIPKRKKTINNFEKTVMEEEYGFTIIGNIANEIETNTITSYTIKIKKNNTNNLENLIIQRDNNNPNDIKAFIFEYLNPYKEHYNGDLKITPIVYNANQVTNTTARIKYECTTVVFPCVNHPFGPASGETCDGPTTKTYCYYTGGDTGNDGGGGSPSGGDTSGSGGNNTNTTSDTSTTGTTENHNTEIITIPAISDAEQPDPCNSLKKKYADSLNVVLKNKTNYLNNSETLNKTHESGFGVTLDNDDPLNPVKYPVLTADGNNAVKVAGVKAYFSVHVHNNDYIDPLTGEQTHTIKIPSPGDFIGIVNDHARNALNFGISLSEVGVVVVTSQGTYALMLENFDIASFSSTIGSNTNSINMTKFKSDYNKDINDKKEEGNLSAAFLEKMLLIIMKDNYVNNRIGLYKATNNDNSAWAKLEYDSRTDQVIQKPCN